MCNVYPYVNCTHRCIFSSIPLSHIAISHYFAFSNHQVIRRRRWAHGSRCSPWTPVTMPNGRRLVFRQVSSTFVSIFFLSSTLLVDCISSVISFSPRRIRSVRNYTRSNMLVGINGYYWCRVLLHPPA